MDVAPTIAVVSASKMTFNATPVFAFIFGWLILEVRAPLFFCKECNISQPRSSFAGNPHPAAAPLAGSAAVSGVVSNPKRTMGPGSVSGALSNAVAYPPPPRSASASVHASSRPSASASAATTAAECATGNDASIKRARQEQKSPGRRRGRAQGIHRPLLLRQEHGWQEHGWRLDLSEPIYH